jgi:hypothetical protein
MTKKKWHETVWGETVNQYGKSGSMIWCLKRKVAVSYFDQIIYRY